jgi:alpha-D-xyloside xylohydrolase
MSLHTKSITVAFVFLFFLNGVTAQKVKVEKLDDGVIVYFLNASANTAKAIQLQVLSEKIIHVNASPVIPVKKDTSLMLVEMNKKAVKWSLSQTKDELIVATSFIKAFVSLFSGAVYFTDLKGNKLLKEKKDGRNFTPVSIDAGASWHITQSFFSPGDEAFYGLGQHQQGLMNYKNNVVQLLQNNSEVAVPFLVSNKNYGILWDNYSITQFGDGRQYEPLDRLKLFDAENKEGGLTATYVLKKNPAEKIKNRIESTIAYDYLPLKSFPASFSLNNGMVTWQGYFQSSFTGLHKFSVRYGGYVKMWIEGKQVLDRWRQCWNPATAIVPVELVRQ